MSRFLDVRCDESVKILTSSCLTFFLSHLPPLIFSLTPSPVHLSPLTAAVDTVKDRSGCPMLLPSTTRTLTSPLKSSFTGANAHAPPKQLSSLTNRNHLAPSSTSARMTATPQTSLTLSTPIIHSTGEPLKHSLKSSHSSLFTPHPGRPIATAHPIRTCDAGRWTFPFLIMGPAITLTPPSNSIP